MKILHGWRWKDDGYRGASLCGELWFKLNFKVKQAFPQKRHWFSKYKLTIDSRDCIIWGVVESIPYSEWCQILKTQLDSKTLPNQIVIAKYWIYYAWAHEAIALPFTPSIKREDVRNAVGQGDLQPLKKSPPCNYLTCQFSSKINGSTVAWRCLG